MKPPRACRLYLVTPPAFEPAAFVATLAVALDTGEIASVLLRLQGAADDRLREAVRGLLPVARARDIAFVLDGHASLAATLDCDGVEIAAGADYPAARAAVGTDRIVGVRCGTSRHEAMEAADAGADYVAFEAPTSVELIGWWSEIMTVPCVASGDPASMAAAGADFLAIGDTIWTAPDPAAAVRTIAAAL